MKRILIVAALAAAIHSASADTSYLLIQGPFGISGSVDSLKWKVNYHPGQITKSSDLLAAVFGSPQSTGTTYTDGFNGTYPIFSAGNNLQGARYIDFGGGAYFVIGFTFNGQTAQMNPSYDPGWNAYVAGGGGAQSYPSGAWTYSGDGITTRTLANGSFDGWVFGATTFQSEAKIANGTTTLAPLAAMFSDATAINLIPEPGSALLLLCGAIMLLRRR